MTTKAEKEAYAIVGRKGGKAIAKKLGKDGMAALGKRGSQIRWGKEVDQDESGYARRKLTKNEFEDVKDGLDHGFSQRELAEKFKVSGDEVDCAESEKSYAAYVKNR